MAYKAPSLSSHPYAKALSKDEKDRVIERLVSKGATKACKRCGKFEHGIGDYLIRLSTFQRNDRGEEMVMPSVLVMCTNCGLASMHTLAVLGMLGFRDGEDV